MSAPRHFIVATSGHVDHGKTALVKALTGIDPDRLPEEKERGITIDLGFAHLSLRRVEAAVNSAWTATSQGEDTAVDGFEVGIIDVPGHEDFVKNMVSGVGAIDAALLVVAADDGWMPQTEEHLQILTYLGVKRAVAVLTKVDLVPSGVSERCASLRQRLAGSAFAEAPIVPVCAPSGLGLDVLKQRLAMVLESLADPPDLGKPRLSVDRVFSLRGVGTVVTGTLAGGRLEQGQVVVLQPGGQLAHVRSIQCYGQSVIRAIPGTRTALNLPELAATSVTASESAVVHRGDVVTVADLGSPTRRIDVELTRWQRPSTPEVRASRVIKHGLRVRFHLGSANVPARLLLLESSVLEPGERALAQLRLDSAVMAFEGDRFVIRDWASQMTLAGGLVLDVEPSSVGLRSSCRREYLAARARNPLCVRTAVLSMLRRDRKMRREGCLRRSHFREEEILAMSEAIVKEGLAVVAGGWLVEATHWATLAGRIVAYVDQVHQDHPEWMGAPLAQVRAMLRKEFPAEDVLDPMMAALVKMGLEQEALYVRRAGFRPRLPGPLIASGERLRMRLEQQPFEPPSRKELAPDETSRQALKFLIENGQVMELGAEVVMLAQHHARAVRMIKRYLRQHGAGTVSSIRAALGTTRRVLVPLLERMDREGLTVRRGDERVLRDARPGMEPSDSAQGSPVG